MRYEVPYTGKKRLWFGCLKSLLPLCLSVTIKIIKNTLRIGTRYECTPKYSVGQRGKKEKKQCYLHCKVLGLDISFLLYQSALDFLWAKHAGHRTAVPRTQRPSASHATPGLSPRGATSGYVPRYPRLSLPGVSPTSRGPRNGKLMAAKRMFVVSLFTKALNFLSMLPFWS